MTGCDELYIYPILQATKYTVLAVTIRSATNKRSVQELHSNPAPDTLVAAGASQKRRKIASAPATGGKPVQYTTSYAKDIANPASSSQHSAAAPKSALC